MPDRAPIAVSALATAEAGRFGAPASDPVILTARDGGTVLQIIGALNHKPDALAAFDVRATGPDQWFAVSDAPIPNADLDTLTDALADTAHVIDQSHGRVRIAIEGVHAAAALAKGVGVDLHPDAFPIGRAAAMQCGHVSVHLSRTGETRFELIVLRGYALTLWESLIEMSLEFGVVCAPGA